MNKALLDTDILSALMRQTASVVTASRNYLALHATLSISIVSRFEILRGLQAKNASSQIASFEYFCHSLEVLPLTDAVVVRAASIYGRLHRAGQLVADADLLIAATGLESGLEVVTNNTAHFSRIPELTLQNWLSS